MERWRVKPLDLVDLVLYKKLHVYEPDGRLVDYKYEDEIRINHPSPFPPSPAKDNPTVYDLIFNAEAYDFDIPVGFVPSDYITLANKVEHCMFKIIQIERFEKEHNLILQDREETKDQKRSTLEEINAKAKEQDSGLSPGKPPVGLKKARKKTMIQVAKEKVREKADELWNKKNQPIPIAEMVLRDELNKITEDICGKIFTEKTLRDWIKDLCPNRKPGRRPNPKKKSVRPTKKTEG